MRKVPFQLAAIAALAVGCSANTRSGIERPAVRVGDSAASQAAATESTAHLLLAAHNRERSAVRVPPLRWSARLEADARAFATQLARSGQLVHSTRQSRPGQGESLWMGTGGAYTPGQMIQNWANERRRFRPGTFPNVSTTGDWSDVSHYTQMIWRSTTDVGCAIQRSGRWDVMVCRYSPAGNVDGRAVP